jgi:hypothetical protein
MPRLALVLIAVALACSGRTLDRFDGRPADPATGAVVDAGPAADAAMVDAAPADQTDDTVRVVALDQPARLPAVPGSPWKTGKNPWAIVVWAP